MNKKKINKIILNSVYSIPVTKSINKIFSTKITSDIIKNGKNILKALYSKITYGDTEGIYINKRRVK